MVIWMFGKSDTFRKMEHVMFRIEVELITTTSRDLRRIHDILRRLLIYINEGSMSEIMGINELSKEISKSILVCSAVMSSHQNDIFVRQD